MGEGQGEGLEFNFRDSARMKTVGTRSIRVPNLIEKNGTRVERVPINYEASNVLQASRSFLRFAGDFASM
jgi:hypothetical protein